MRGATLSVTYAQAKTAYIALSRLTKWMILPVSLLAVFWASFWKAFARIHYQYWPISEPIWTTTLFIAGPVVLAFWYFVVRTHEEDFHFSKAMHDRISLAGIFLLIYAIAVIPMLFVNLTWITNFWQQELWWYVS